MQIRKARISQQDAQTTYQQTQHLRTQQLNQTEAKLQPARVPLQSATCFWLQRRLS